MSDTAGEIDDPMAVHTSSIQAPHSQRLRTRRKAKPPTEQLLGDENNNSDFSSRLSNKNRRLKRKNLILNTRNPVIIWLAKNELQISLFLLSIVHIFYWAGYQWPLQWIRIQHKSTLPNNGTVDHDSDRYVRGIHDIKFVCYWIVQIIAARSLFLHHILPVFARYLKITSLRKNRRFCEMVWMLIYVVPMWTIGFRIWQNSPYYMNMNNFYINYPDEHILMPYGLKWFYLVQSAFWFSSIYTIHIEERRKDHVEMLTHHVVTICLVLGSYQFYFTRFGHAFMLIMDLPDIFLTAAKMFRYLDNKIMPDILFGMFTISWVATKHYLCIKMMISIWTLGINAMPEEKRYPNYPNSYASYTVILTLWGFLCILQLILIYWFVLILKVLNRVLIKGEGADDNRSDEEGEGEGEESADDPALSDTKTSELSSVDSSSGSLSTLDTRSPSAE